MADVARPWGVDREYDYTRSLRLLDRVVDVRAGGATGPIAIDPIRNHQSLSAHWSLRPLLDQVSDRELGTGVHTSISEW